MFWGGGHLVYIDMGNIKLKQAKDPLVQLQVWPHTWPQKLTSEAQ